MLRRIYDWTLQKAAAPAAEAWLATIAFIESSVFLIPADVLFVPMALAKPARAYRYALTATLASTLGGTAGYYLGHYAYEEIAKPILAFYGKLGTFEQLRSSASRDGPKPFHGTERTAGTRRGLSLAAAKGDRFRPFPALIPSPMEATTGAPGPIVEAQDQGYLA